MAQNKLIQRESLLHWIWQSLRFDLHNLQTRGGEKLQIRNPGSLNHTDGPDFLSAEIQVNQLTWHGNIEIHLCEKDWYYHQHHMDPSYNNVILHVILFSDAKRRVKREDGTVPFTLCLRPYLKRNLTTFLKTFNSNNNRKYLPCSRHSNGILRDDIFRRQLARAHTSYFYQKVYDQYIHWDHRKSKEDAWRRMLVLSLFDGLGISHNRESMKRLGVELFKRNLIYTSREKLTRHTIALAGLSSESNSQKENPPLFNWNTKSVRPANRPVKRITQGIYLLKKVIHTSMDTILQRSTEKIWNAWIADPSIPGLGKERSSLLYGICLLPCLKIAADLHDNHQRSREIRKLWNKHRTTIPDSYKQILDNTLINSDIYVRRLGSVYQLRHYCFKHRCSDCLVFQKAFSS